MRYLFAAVLILAAGTSSAEVIVNQTPAVSGFFFEPEFPTYPAAKAYNDLVPTLNDHPSTNDIPESGMMYKIDDGTNIVWWICRQGDVIATQLSAHDSDGNAIISSIDLATDIETVIPIGERDGLRNAAVTELNLTQAQIDAIKAYFSADVDALFPTMTAQQRNFLKVQRALVKMLTKSELQEVQP